MSKIEFGSVYLEASDMPDDPSFIQDVSRSMSEGMTAIVEQKIRMAIKPKPRLVPQRLWFWLAARFLVVEQTRPNMGIDFAHTKLPQSGSKGDK